MHDYKETETRSDEFDDAYHNFDHNRPRPMTSADYIGGNPRALTQRQQQQHMQDYGSQENFPPLETGFRNLKPNSASARNRSKKEKLSTATLSTQPLAGSLQAVPTTKRKLIHNPSAELIKLKPRKIAQEKERLYEENLHLKQAVNGLKEENMKYRTKINHLEKEANKFERMIQEVNPYKNVAPNGKAAEGILSLTLKQNIRELRQVLKMREDELLEIKKNMKYTKVHELEIQMKAYEEETVRLRTVMDFMVRGKAHIAMSEDEKNRFEDDYFVQMTQLKTLKKDNEEMATAIKILEEQNFEYEKKISELEKKNKRDASSYKKDIQEKEKELTRMKNDQSGNFGSTNLLMSRNSRRPMSGAPRDDPVRQELEKKTMENANLINQLAEKRNQVLNLERQLRDLKSDFNDKNTFAQNEKQSLLRELEKLKNAKAAISNDNVKGKEQNENELQVSALKLDDYVRRASLQRTFSQDEKNLILNNMSSKPEKRKKGTPQKRVQKVRPENVQSIGKEINYRLRAKRLTFEDIDKVIWPEKVRKVAAVTIKDMIQILKGTPINMLNEDEVILTARYLIEDNEHEFLLYDESAKNDLHVVKSILKKMIGHLPVYDEDRVRKLHEDITQICVQYCGGLKENLKVICKSGFLTAKDLKQACDIMDVTLTDEQVEYCLQKVFEYSNSIHKLSIDKLFEIFSDKPLIKMEEEPRSYTHHNIVITEASPMKKGFGEEPDGFRRSFVGQEHPIAENHEEDSEEESRTEESNDTSEVSREVSDAESQEEENDN